MRLHRSAWLAAVAAVASAAAAGCATGGHDWWTAPDPTYDDTADADYVQKGIAALRAEHRRGPTALFSVARLHLANARKSVDDGRDPMIAVERAVERLVDEGMRGVNYWRLKTDRLEALDLPMELFQPRRLSLAVAVFRQQEGHHPRYLVVLVTSSLLEHEEPR